MVKSDAGFFNFRREDPFFSIFKTKPLGKLLYYAANCKEYAITLAAVKYKQLHVGSTYETAQLPAYLRNTRSLLLSCFWHKSEQGSTSTTIIIHIPTNNKVSS